MTPPLTSSPYNFSNLALIPTELGLLLALTHTTFVPNPEVCPCYCPAKDMQSPTLCSITFKFLSPSLKAISSMNTPSIYSEFQRLPITQYL